MEAVHGWWVNNGHGYREDRNQPGQRRVPASGFAFRDPLISMVT